MSSSPIIDITRVKKSSFPRFRGLISLTIDATICVFLAIPLLWIALFKSVFVRRKNIRGKLVLVTGGGQGLGRAISLKLAEMGCNIAVADLNEETARAVAEEVKQKGVQAKGYRVDISKNDETRKLRGDIKNDFGPVDILINNAGIVPDMSNEGHPSFLETMVKVNVLGTILMTRFILEQMKQQNGGHIVTISSMSGLHASPFAVPYSATKAAVNSYMSGLTEKLRMEKLGDKIKLTCICPYYVATRKDIVDFLNPDIRFPPLEVEEAANQIIDAIVRVDSFITIPFYYKYGVKFSNLFPLSVQQLVRDRILKEYDFKNPKK